MYPLTQEMSILSSMHHPHIVLLIGACLDSSLPSLVYELAEGGKPEHMPKCLLCSAHCLHLNN